MSKALRTVGMVVAAVALVAATAGMAAPAVAATATTAASAGGVAGVSAATLTAIGSYGGLAAGALSAISGATAPGFSSGGSASSFTTNPQSGLPYAMGRTRMSGLRMYANTNTRPGYTKFNDLLWFGALLSIGGQIEGIEKFTADNELVTFDPSGNAIGNFRDYMGQKIHTGGSQASALSLTLGGGSAPGWSGAHRLSGVTHAMWCLRYNKQGEMYGAGAPEPAWIGKWVKVYDPRLDSTFPGGSGPCRALQEGTYVWSDNPGLHALTWALGRWQNGKRTCGIGAPVQNIRVAEFVECANVAEANGWKVGGVEWTTASKWDTLKRILQAGGAVPTQTGAMIGCLVSAPRTAIATIESRHLLDSLSIAATKSRRDRFNTVIPRYVDEDSDWSVISGTAVTEPAYVAADGGQRTKEIDFPLVQVFAGYQAKQPGQLAAYAIVDSREAGPFTFSTGPEWIGLKTGDVVYLNVPEEGLAYQPVLITRRAIDPSTGKVSFSAQTETYSKHAYALGESTTPPAPFALTAPDLKPAAPLSVNWNVSGTTSGEGFPALLVIGESELPSADAVIIDYRKHDQEAWTSSAILSAVESVAHVIAPLESETAYDVRIGYRIGTIDGNFTIFLNVTTGLGKITVIDGRLNALDLDVDLVTERIEAARLAIEAIDTLTTEIIDNAASLREEVRRIEVGGNLLANSDFEAGTSSWELVASVPEAHSWGIDNAGFTVPDEHYQGLSLNEPNGAYDAAIVSEWVPVSAGGFIQASAWLAARECVAKLRLQWGDLNRNFLPGAAESEDVSDPYRGGPTPDADFKRVWVKGLAPSNARFARLVTVKGGYLEGPVPDLSWAFMLRPMLAVASSAQTSPSTYLASGAGSGPGAPHASLVQVETAAIAAGQAAVEVRQELTATAGDIDARLLLTGHVAAEAADRTSGARWSLEAIGPGGRGALTVYYYDHDGVMRSGVDLVGDVTISGDLTIDGTLRPRKIDAALFAREGTSVWNGSMTPGIGQSLVVPFSLTLNPIQPQGRFFYELYVGLATNANTQQVSAHLGSQLYTNFVDDGGLFLRSYDDQGNTYVPKHGGSEGVRATTVFGTTFVANLSRGNLDTGIVADGDYYYRNVSATYTLTKLDLHVTWIAV